MSAGPLDRPHHFTLFPNLEARERESVFCSLREFAERLRDARAPTKHRLRLFSCCSYDNKRTSKGALRHDDNVRECHCIVGDYDGERAAFDDAVAAAQRVGVAMVIVTTASHTPAKPRWRAIASLAAPLHKNGSLREHAKLVSRLAGIFPDDIGVESWTLSQSWYCGTTDDAPDHCIALIDGVHLDELLALDDTARPKPKPKQGAEPRPSVTRQPKPASDDQVLADPGKLVPTAVAKHLDAISQGVGSHDALVRLAGKFAARGTSIKAAVDMLLDAAGQRPEDQRDAGWHRMRDDIPRVLEWAYSKEAEAQGRLATVIASAARRARAGNGASNGTGEGAGGSTGSGANEGAGRDATASLVVVDDP